MGEHTLTSDGQIASTLAFCVDSFATCFSNGADQLCVSIALSCVSALLLLVSCLVLTYQRCKIRGENPGETNTSSYCFLGNLCGTVGAILSRQLHILIVMGAFAAVTDAVIFVSFLSVCWISETERRRRMMMRRRRQQRRQHLLGVCMLMVLAGFLNSRVNRIPTERPLNGRRLLQIPIQDNTEILGYTLGLLSFVIACTSKFPSLQRAYYRGQAVTTVGVLSGVLCSLSSGLYASAILLYNTQFEFVLRVMPWLLSAICSATLDLLVSWYRATGEHEILVIQWCRRGTKLTPVRYSPDTESLLGDLNTSSRRQGKQQIGLPVEIKKKNVQKMTEIGHYMDVSVQPARNICLKEVAVSGEGTTEEPTPNTTVKVIRLHGVCSSDSSRDSSALSSDLEWDFEEPNTQRRDTTSKQKERDEFPLQEWPSNPKPLNVCTCATSGLPQKTASGKENASGCVESFDK